MALGLEFFDELDRAAFAVFFGGDTGAGIFVHGNGMQRNVGAAPGIRRRGQVIGIDLAGALEHCQLNRLGHFRAGGEPLRVSPTLQHRLGVSIALFGLFLHVMKLVKHQQGELQSFGSLLGHCGVGIAEQINQGADVVAAQHGAQQVRGLLAGDERALFSAVRYSRQVTGLDFGRIIHTCRHTVSDEIDQRFFFALGRVFQQINDLSSLLSRQRHWRDTLSGTFGNMGTVSSQELGHYFSPGVQKKRGWKLR